MFSFTLNFINLKLKKMKVNSIKNPDGFISWFKHCNFSSKKYWFKHFFWHQMTLRYNFKATNLFVPFLMNFIGHALLFTYKKFYNNQDGWFVTLGIWFISLCTQIIISEFIYIIFICMEVELNLMHLISRKIALVFIDPYNDLIDFMELQHTLEKPKLKYQIETTNKKLPHDVSLLISDFAIDERFWIDRFSPPTQTFLVKFYITILQFFLFIPVLTVQYFFEDFVTSHFISVLHTYIIVGYFLIYQHPRSEIIKELNIYKLVVFLMKRFIVNFDNLSTTMIV